MGKKGKKTRWRRLPIGGGDEEGGLSLESAPPTTDHRTITFNEDEYTKITTPRQDVLFKKGYLGRKRAAANPSPCDNQELHSNDSVESESYVSEEPQFVYPPPTGYIDPTGLYYGNACDVYDPYTGTVVTMVVGPAPQCPGAPLLAALPCQPLPLQPLEWAPPAPGPWCYSYNRKKRYSTDSQNCSAQSSESTGPPGSPQEPGEEACAPAMYPPQYVYPGYMFGPPVYTMNGMTVQGVIPQPVPMVPDLSSKRRKKRRRRRRGGVTDDGSESSCCEEACLPGDSSDAGSKGNSDSGIHTDPTPSPPLADDEPECVSQRNAQCLRQSDLSARVLSTAEEDLSTGEDDTTQCLSATAPEFMSQECTLSCSSTFSVTKDLTTNDSETPTDNFLIEQETLVSLEEDGADSTCMLAQETEIFSSEDGIGSDCLLMPEPSSSASCSERVYGSCRTQQQIAVDCSGKDSVPDNCSSRHGIVVCSDEASLKDNHPMEQDSNVTRKEQKAGGSCLLLHDTVLFCTKKEEVCTLNESNHQPPFLSLSPECSDPLKPTIISNDLITPAEEHKDAAEKAVDNIRELQQVESGEEIYYLPDPAVPNLLNESKSAQCMPTGVFETITVNGIEKEECELISSKEKVEKSVCVATTLREIETSMIPETSSNLRLKVENDVVIPSKEIETSRIPASPSNLRLPVTEDVVISSKEIEISTVPESPSTLRLPVIEDVVTPSREIETNMIPESPSNLRLPVAEDMVTPSKEIETSMIFESPSNLRLPTTEDMVTPSKEIETCMILENPSNLRLTVTEDVVTPSKEIETSMIFESPSNLRLLTTEEVVTLTKEIETITSPEIPPNLSLPTKNDNLATPLKEIESSKTPESPSNLRLAEDNDDRMVPIPPPRRKKSMCRAAERLAIRVVEEAIREGVEEAAHNRLSSPLSITEAVTRWLNSHESSPFTCRVSDSESEDEDGIEAVEEKEMTGQKNVRGNPFPVPSHNGMGQRVAKDCESVISEWDFGCARDMCDPARSVDKYYRLGADGGDGDRVPPSVYKTAVHIRHNGPFPCGVCCIIQ